MRNPLPYRYIQDLRQILCPLPDKAELTVIEQNLPQGESLLPSYHYRHFKHWTWAQEQAGQRKSGGDWFEVEPDLIDKSDPDCVWRTKEVTRDNKRITLHQIWSPVKAMVIFMKLHLPLRTYQVRMLDSGEADTWRYESGRWKLNDKHDFALGSEKRPFGKGIIRRIHDTMTGQYSTGLYINTNKTADQNKDELERGYIIPWQNEEVLYWLEKLRNWQEKYNPIVKPTDCTTLLTKHIGKHKSQTQLESMGEIAFLFRDASAKGEDKYKPICGAANIAPFLGVSVMQLVAPLVIFVPVFAFLGVNGVPQADGSVMSLANAAWIWVPLLAIATIAAWSGMNDIASSRASIADQLPVLQRLHLWLLSLLYLATFGSFIGFSAGFAMLAKTQFPDVNILRLAFFGPFIGAIARSVGGAISDKFGGVRVTLINFIFMAIFSALLFLTLPGTGSGNFIAFYAVFMGLFLTAGLGSGSTFQMIAVIFRQITIYRVKIKGGSDEQAQKEAVTETAAALGFISAIGAVGGFFIPQAFGMSLNMTGSPVGAMKVFLIFYIVCVLLTWLVYGRRKFSQK